MAPSGIRGPARPSSSSSRLASGKRAIKSQRGGPNVAEPDEDDAAETITIENEPARKRLRETVSGDTSSTGSGIEVARAPASQRVTRSRSNGPAAASTSRARGKGKGKGKGKSIAKRPPAGRGKTIVPSMYNQQITVYNDDSSSDGGRVRSLSPNGLPWEVEKLKITPDDFADRIQYYHKFKVPMKNDAKGKLEDIIFREGDVIWVCPDPSWLSDEDLETVARPVDLDIGEWWLASVEKCCTLEQDDPVQPYLGFLKIRWFYNLCQLRASEPRLCAAWATELNRYKFRDYEFIYSDHYDLIGLQCYGGHAPGFLAWLEVKGLAVNADPDILLPPAQRSKGKRTQKWIDGFSRRGNGRIAKEAAIVGYNEGDRKPPGPGEDLPYESSDDRISEVD